MPVSAAEVVAPGGIYKALTAPAPPTCAVLSRFYNNKIYALFISGWWTPAPPGM